MSGSESSSPAEASAVPSSAWVRAAALAGLVLVTRLPGLVARRTFNTDEATLGLGGRALADGGRLYVDLIDRKPPFPFAAYAVFGVADLRLIRLFVALLVLAAALLAASEADRRWGSPAGWVTGVVFVVGAATLGPNDAQAANFELFAVLPITVAVVASARGRVVVPAVALAVAVLCKQPAAVTFVPVAWSWWRWGRWRNVALGIAAGALAGLALAAPFGVANVAEWALLGTGGYLGFGLGELANAALRLLALIALGIGFWGGAWLLARPEPRSDRSIEGRGEDQDLVLLLVVSLLALLPGLRLFPHYLLQALPAVALLAGRGAARVPARVRPALAWGTLSALSAAVLAWSVALTPAPAVERAVAQAVAGFSVPGDEVLVWGNLPEVAWLADRAPAGGYPHSEFFTGYSGGRRPRLAAEADLTGADRDRYDRWIADLEADPPTVAVDTAAADLRGGRWFPLSRFPALSELIETRYERVATIEGVNVYRLREGP